MLSVKRLATYYLYDALSKLFAAALGSNEAGRVTLPTDRPRDTPCYQGNCDNQILRLLSSYFVFIKIVTYHIYRFLSYLAFLQLHWMRQTFNNKNQKTYDEYRQGCRWLIVLDYSKSNHIFVWQNWTVFETFFASRCSFILRRVGQVSSFSGGEGAGSQKKKLKKVKKVWAERNPS